jgi:hypothetical protein
VANARAVQEGRIPGDLDRSAGGVGECASVVAPGLRVRPRFAAICHVVHRKLSGCLRASGFIRKYSQEFKKDVRGLSRGALLALAGYDWPGNVRELENIIERSVALATRPVIGLDDLPLDLAMNEVTPGRGEGEVPLTLKEARDRFEQAYVLRALEREDWNQSRAARGLGVHRNTLIARLAAWGFRRGQPGISVRPVAGDGGSA